MRRSNMFQQYCTTSTRRAAMQVLISSSLKLESPTALTLPCFTRSSSARIGSSKGIVAIGPVDEIDIDIVGIERLEALFDRLHHALAAAVAVVRQIRISDAELGRDDSFLAPRSERFGQRLLRRAHAIGLGGIEAVESRRRAPD